MFDPYAHEVDACKQGELDSSLLNNNKLSMWANSLLQCIVHVPKQTQTDRQEFWASTKVEFQGHLLTIYTIK